jgi:hypothetical protein
MIISPEQDEACLYRYKGVEASVEARLGAAPANFCEVLRNVSRLKRHEINGNYHPIKKIRSKVKA